MSTKEGIALLGHHLAHLTAISQSKMELLWSNHKGTFRLSYHRQMYHFVLCQFVPKKGDC